MGDLFNLSNSEMANLPDELIEQIRISKNDILRSRVVDLLSLAERPLKAKQLTIGLYKKYGIYPKNSNQFSSLLHRMKNDSIIISVKRGYYTLPQSSETKQASN